MKRPQCSIAIRCLLLALYGMLSLESVTFAMSGDAGPSKPVVVASPDGRIRVEVAIGVGSPVAAGPQYSVTFKGRPLLSKSPLRIDFADGTSIGAQSLIEGTQARSVEERYRQYPGKRSRVIDRCSEAVIALRERGDPARRWELVVRAYDDGAAIRYRFPEQEQWKALAIASERTAFEFPPGTRAFVLPLNTFTGPYEKRYEHRSLETVPVDWLLGLPLLAEVPETGWLSITEANLTEYAGMYLAREAGTGATLTSRLSPLPREPEVAVRARLPHSSPWRVFMIAEQPLQMIESDLVLNLNEPCAIEDTSWIKPGKTTFPWWNGFHEEDVPFTPGLNTETARYYIDFCAEAGFAYHSLDGLANKAWYGGKIVPYEGFPPTKGIPGLDFEEVRRHARARGIRLRLWMHWQAAEAHMAEAFPLYRRWGIEGVMIDFMDRDDQEMVRFLRSLLETAAENRLTVTLHGVSKPTGLERTYPNLLSSEAVLNLEYDKWDPVGVPPDHGVTVAFTRMLAGPLDFHQGSFRTVSVADFKPRNEAPRIMGTPCRTLASYVVFQNHLPMVADYPSAYRGHPALKVLAAVPATWDDTKAIAGEPAEYVVIARRSGDHWWVGAMTNHEKRVVRIPLTFLGSGSFQGHVFRDDTDAPHGLAVERRIVRADDTLTIPLAEAGGLLVRLSPEPTSP